MKINVGTKDELEVIGYKAKQSKQIATVVLCIISGGILLFFLSWKDSIRVKFTHVPCDAGEATIVLVEDIYGQIWKEKIEDEDSESPSGVKVKRRFFTNKKIKYVWNKDGAIFERLSFPSVGTRICELRDFTGLTWEEAGRRRQIYGENVIEVEIPTFWQLFIGQAFNPFYIFQAYTVIVWTAQLYVIYAACIFFLSVTSLVLNVWETRRQSRVLREKTLTQSKVEVIRNGKVFVLDSKELVPGDLVNVEAGPDLLEADILLLEGSSISNEAILTGESVPTTKVTMDSNDDSIFDVEKHRRHILHCGTQVLQVRGGRSLRSSVIRTGYDSVKGELIRSILFPKPLDFQIYSDFLRLIAIFITLGLAAMTWSLVNWSMVENVSSATIIFNSIDLLTFVVPPIIPATITAINLWAQKRLERKKIFCLSSNYISLSGPVDIICFDKTGTLTEDDLSLEGIVPSIDGEFHPHVKDLQNLPKYEKFTQAMATCHSVVKIENGSLLGNPLDIKIFNAIGWNIYDTERDTKSDEAKPLFMVTDKGQQQQSACEYEVFKTFPFESSEQRMTVISKEKKSNSFEIFIKGAPEKIASLCVKESVPEIFQQILEWYTKQGLRILAAASKSLSPSLSLDQITNTPKETLEKDSRFLGMIIFQNRLKPETIPALDVLHKALLNTVMVTGDNLLTATSVARECGLVKANQQIIFVRAEHVSSSSKGVERVDVHFKEYETRDQTELDENFSAPLKPLINRNYVFGIDGDSFQLLSQYDRRTFKKVIHRGKIFARMKPDQKCELIEELQGLGHQVAMCGDGCNDCGALKAAHAGISLSTNESSVAAPFTSLQQDIRCMSTLIREGRATLVSSYVSFKYNISYSFASLIVVLFIFTKFTEPSDTQYLIMDLVLITVPSLVMGNTEAADELSVQKPSRRVVHPLHVTSIISFLGLQVLLYWLTWNYLETQAWFEPFEAGNGDNRAPPGYEPTVILMQAFFAFVIAAIIFSHDFPFRQPFYKNKILTAYLVFSTILCTIFMFVQVEWLYKFIDFKAFPYTGFTVTIFFSVWLAGAIGYVWERWFLYGVIEKVFMPWVRKLLGPRLPFERLEQTILNDSTWPRLDNGTSGVSSIEVTTLGEDTNHDASHPHGFFRKTTKRHKFVDSDVKYVDELKPVSQQGNNENTFRPQENCRSSPQNHEPGRVKLCLEDTSDSISREEAIPTYDEENHSTNAYPNLASLGIVNQEKHQLGADCSDDASGSEVNLIKEMNQEWVKVRNSLHDSMKNFEMEVNIIPQNPT